MNPGWAINLLQNCMGLRPGERVLVLVDAPLRAAGEALVAAAGPLGAGAAAVRVLPLPRSLAVIPQPFLQQVEAADVIVSLFSGLDLERESPILRAGMAAFRAARRGRWGAGACIDEAVLQEDLAADCQAIATRTAAAAGRLARAAEVRITTAVGTDLRLRLGGRPIHQDAGLLHTPGAYGNLPAGEAFVAPLEDSAEGILVVDLSIGDIPLDQPVALTFRQGRAVAAEGGVAVRELQRRLGADPGAWTLGEFGVGTNPGVRIRHRAPQDEKALGTAHVALGDNTHFGGANAAASHYDCVVHAAKIYLDGATIW